MEYHYARHAYQIWRKTNRTKLTMYKKHTICRACQFGKDPNPPGIKAASFTEKLIPVFSLGIQPLANDFRKSDEEHSGFAPLEVLFCPRCSLAQLSVVVNPDILYSSYSYVTSTSATMQTHFSNLLQHINRTNLGNVLEVGSNDGRFLAFLKEHGATNVVGVDPAGNLAAIANNSGITTIVSQFDADSAKDAEKMIGKIDTIFARHVFCHIDDWTQTINAFSAVSHKDTMIVIEVPYAKDTLDKTEFDQCYHEHLSFMSLKAMKFALKGSPLFIQDAIHMPIHGGAIVIVLRHTESDLIQTDRVTSMIESENITVDTWNKFAVDSNALIQTLKTTVQDLSNEGNMIVGYGASAKSTVWVNACKFTKKEIQFITDTTQQKQCRFSPGTVIPIVDPGALLRELPNYAICFAWNFKEEILSKESRYREKGGKFIIPIPKIEIL